MRIAFYAPLKPAASNIPSGDRQMARALIAALALSGHEVDIASVFRTRDGAGDANRQRRLAHLGAGLARRLVRRYERLAGRERPSAWLTYHVYHKAPDWLGPTVAGALGIPYLIAEASFAPKQQGGPWAIGHAAAADAIRRADAVLGLNSRDAVCVRPLLADPARLHSFRPFTDIGPFAAAVRLRDRHRAQLASELSFDRDDPILLAVAMMRPGDKLASFRVLGEALGRLLGERWRLVVAGDGPARPQVAEALARLGQDRVRFVGEQPLDRLAGHYAAADMQVWPAINEAFGIALIEAQAAGLPVVAGNVGGVGDIVRDGETGLLVPAGDSGAFARAVQTLLRAPDLRLRMAAAARRTAARDHGLEVPARRLNDILGALVEGVAA
jgi:glycosyltransferase involved in cell wall biosynthesis